MHQFGEPIQLHIDGPFYVGIGFVSHLPAYDKYRCAFRCGPGECCGMVWATVVRAGEDQNNSRILGYIPGA